MNLSLSVLEQMNDTRFAELWPTAEALGWTFDNCGVGYYVTPPDERNKRSVVWEYIAYKDMIVYVPNWFESEIIKEQVVQKKLGWKRWLKSFIWPLWKSS